MRTEELLSLKLLDYRKRLSSLNVIVTPENIHMRQSDTSLQVKWRKSMKLEQPFVPIYHVSPSSIQGSTRKVHWSFYCLDMLKGRISTELWEDVAEKQK